jgi:molecular chaperone HscB
MENYFDLYQLKPSFLIDLSVLQGQYEALDKEYRSQDLLDPRESAQTEADSRAELNKLAFITLSDPQMRMAYILKLYGFLQDGEAHEPDPDFLVEVMELQELVTEYELEPKNTILREDAKGALQTSTEYWDKETAPLFRRFEEGDHSTELMHQVKEYYFRSIYLSEIRQRMEALETYHTGS